MAHPHYTWPYPRRRPELVQVLMVSLFALFVGVIFAAAKLHAYESRVLQPKNIQQAAESLSSVTAEVDILTGRAERHETLQSYQEAYLKNSADQVGAILTLLRGQEAVRDERAAKQKLVHEAQQLQTILEQLAKTTDVRALQHGQQELRRIQNAVQPLESKP
jgi:hypothetical protein